MARQPLEPYSRLRPCQARLVEYPRIEREIGRIRATRSAPHFGRQLRNSLRDTGHDYFRVAPVAYTRGSIGQPSVRNLPLAVNPASAEVTGNPPESFMACTSQHGKAFIRPKRKAHLLVIEARFHDDLADALLEGVRCVLEEPGATWDVVTVPGPLERHRSVISFAPARSSQRAARTTTNFRGAGHRGARRTAPSFRDRRL